MNRLPPSPTETAAVSSAAAAALSARLRVARYDSADAFDAFAAEWDDLFRASGADHPFATGEWASAWWRHLRRDSALVRDSIAFRTVRDADSRLVAIAPLIRTERPATGPMRSVSLQFLGADPNITELRGVLYRPGCEKSVYAALLSDLLAENEEGGHAWDWIRWNGLASGADSAGELVRRQPACRALPQTPVSLLSLAPTWDEFRTSLKRNIRESLRKCYNSLRREGHSFSVTVAGAPDEIAKSLDRFFPLHRARAEMPGSVQHADVFAHPDAQRFLHDVCRRFAVRPDGPVVPHVFELWIEGRLIASRIAFRVGTTLYLYYSGFDPIWARYSVMTTLVAEMIRWAIDNSLQTVNLSTGIDVSKSRWGPRVIYCGNAIQFAPGARAGLAYRAYEVGNSLKAHLDR